MPMDHNLTGLALTAGMVAALNPCGFAMLPAYLTLVVHGNDGEHRGAVMRALVATAAMSLGFVMVFTSFGVLTASVASAIQQYLPYITVIIGLILISLGVWLLLGRQLSAPAWLSSAGTRWAPTSRLSSMFGYGIGYAIASLSCTIGPFLAVTGSSFRSSSTLNVIGVYAAYAAGFTLIVGVLAIAVAFTSSTLMTIVRQALPYVHRIGAVIVIMVGLYVGYYGLYEIRLFSAAGDPADPIITAASRLQGTLANWVYHHGVWPWLLILGLLGASAIVGTAVTTISRIRRTKIRPSHKDEPVR